VLHYCLTGSSCPAGLLSYPAVPVTGQCCITASQAALVLQAYLVTQHCLSQASAALLPHRQLLSCRPTLLPSIACHRIVLYHCLTGSSCPAGLLTYTAVPVTGECCITASQAAPVLQAYLATQHCLSQASAALQPHRQLLSCRPIATQKCLSQANAAQAYLVTQHCLSQDSAALLPPRQLLSCRPTYSAVPVTGQCCVTASQAAPVL
jgi:hypothetical protein